MHTLIVKWVKIEVEFWLSPGDPYVLDFFVEFVEVGNGVHVTVVSVASELVVDPQLVWHFSLAAHGEHVEEAAEESVRIVFGLSDFLDQFFG